MAKVVSFAAFKAARVAVTDPVVGEIADALMHLGGAAHRQDVADWIARRRSGRSNRASIEEQSEVFSAFATYLKMSSRSRRAGLMRQSFGPDSYRWELTFAGVELFLAASAKATSEGAH